MKTATLNNGITMPMLGFGVYQIAPEQTEAAVVGALQSGYRLIDTAAAYMNAVCRVMMCSSPPSCGCKMPVRPPPPKPSTLRCKNSAWIIWICI